MSKVWVISFPRISVIEMERWGEESYILWMRCMCMFEDYDSFSCMLSVLHYIENLNIERIRSKKELYEHMRSLIELLCKDRESRMYFMSMWVGIIDNDGLMEDELKARAYELYKQDQNRKENSIKYR